MPSTWAVAARKYRSLDDIWEQCSYTSQDGSYPTDKRKQMTSTELAALPVGSIVLLDGEMGEVIQAGVICHVMWKEVTNIIRTESKAWQEFISWLEAE